MLDATWEAAQDMEGQFTVKAYQGEDCRLIMWMRMVDNEEKLVDIEEKERYFARDGQAVQGG